MKYKAVIFDLDGTAIPNRPDGLPSKRLAETVAKAKNSFIVTIATGRPITNCRTIIKSLNIEAPCLISGGTQIIEPRTEKTLWEKPLSVQQLSEVVKVCSSYPNILLFGDELLTDPSATSSKNKKVTSAERVVYLMTVPNDARKKIIGDLNLIHGIKVAEVPSWTPDCVDLHITHSEATKEYGLKVLFEILGVRKEEVVGVGDGNNDLPLFESVGFKVAMGNATPEMKAIADYLAPSVEEDGVAVTLEKVIKGDFDI